MEHATNRKLNKSAIATALVVIVVMAFTLSTATFAWFSSSNRVTVSISEFTADAGGGSLALQWYGLTIPGETEISMDPPAPMGPMAPEFRPLASQQDLANGYPLVANEYRRLDKSLTRFVSSTVTPAGTFETDGRAVTPYRTQKTYEGETYKYMQITAGGDVTTGIQVTAAFADAENQSDLQKGNYKRLRVAVYQYIPMEGSSIEDDKYYCYIGTLGHVDANTTDNDQRIAYGTITAGQNAGETGYMFKGANANNTDAETAKNYNGASATGTLNFYLPADNGVALKAGQSIYLTCLVWYDGNLLTSTAGAGGTASVKLSFSII